MYKQKRLAHDHVISKTPLSLYPHLIYLTLRKITLKDTDLNN